jgi:glycosyltransferase involved in cell wall biosynthesis
MRGVVGEVIAAAGVFARLQPHARKLVADGAEFGKSLGVNRVIAILDGPLAMLMAAPLAERLQVSLHALVWDVPEHVLPSFGHTAWSTGPLRRGFDAALRRSESVAVMSRAMQRRFADEYGARTTILRQPIDAEWTSGVGGDSPRGDDDFVIGFAGSVTAREEVELLCRALDAMNWTLSGRRVRLRVFGLRFVCQAQAPRWIEYRGYVPDTADVVRGLGACDLLFLPQPFGAPGRPFAEYSFPTKFTTYLAAGRPMLVLTPAYSAVGEFCREHELPIVCDRSEIVAIREFLGRFAGDPGEALELEERLRAVAASEFSRQTSQTRLAEWLSDEPTRAASSSPARSPVDKVPAVAVHH